MWEISPCLKRKPKSKILSYLTDSSSCNFFRLYLRSCHFLQVRTWLCTQQQGLLQQGSFLMVWALWPAGPLWFHCECPGNQAELGTGWGEQLCRPREPTASLRQLLSRGELGGPAGPTLMALLAGPDQQELVLGRAGLWGAEGQPCCSTYGTGTGSHRVGTGSFPGSCTGTLSQPLTSLLLGNLSPLSSPVTSLSSWAACSHFPSPQCPLLFNTVLAQCL